MSIPSLFIVATTITAIVTAILTTMIAVFLLRYFINPKQKQSKIITMKSVENSKKDNKTDHTIQVHTDNKSDNRQKQTKSVEITKYFVYSGSSVVIFNALCSIFNAIFCIYLIIDPEDDTVTFYKHHSYFLRILSTIAWYIGTGSVIWFFNGRLFYVFNGSVLQSSEALFKFINIFITVYGLSSLICAYCAVYLQNLIIQEIAFTSFRISYQIIIFMILYMFSKRLLFLNMQNKTLAAMEIKMGDTSNTTNTPSDSPSIYNNNKRLDDAFMEVTAKNSVLVFITATSVLLVTLSWSAFRWFLLSRSRTTLLIPMNMASVDSLLNSVSIIMLLRFGDGLYDTLCCCCHKSCVLMCGQTAKCVTINDM